MNPARIDPERWNEVWSADLDVLRNMRANGDRPEVTREIDVSFRGSLAKLQLLIESAANFGFRVQKLIEADDQGEPWLFLVRDQTADEDAIRDLTVTYLQIEDAFDVECDGWGCITQNDKA